MGVSTIATTILLSRQPLRPSRKSAWVNQSAAAVASIAQHGEELVSSIGTPTWDLLTALASDFSLPITLILPASDSAEFDSIAHDATEQFDLNPDQVRFVPSITSGKPTGEESMQARDRLICAHADTLIPVSLRPGSTLGKLLESDLAAGKTVIDTFRVPYEKRTAPIAYKIDRSSLNSELSDMADRYLTHWTRSFHHKWPDETQIDYYRDIIRSNSYPRSACDTLHRIISTGIIRASSKRMPAKCPCVSFSSLAPADLLPLISWRARHRQMAFEPYGIGIRKKLADKLNIHPVIYSAPTDSTVPRWLHQSPGKITDWRREKEHRHLGNFNLQGVARDDLVAFVHTPDEAEALEHATGIRTIPFIQR